MVLPIYRRRDADAAIGTAPPGRPPGTAYPGPALFVAGARSNYIQPEHEPGIRRLFPRARIIRIEGAGHWVHAEQPQAFLRAVSAFLSSAA